MHVNFRIPDSVIEKLDTFIDGIRYRNRAQLITVALAEWIEENQNIGSYFSEDKTKSDDYKQQKSGRRKNG